MNTDKPGENIKDCDGWWWDSGTKTGLIADVSRYFARGSGYREFLQISNRVSSGNGILHSPPSMSHISVSGLIFPSEHTGQTKSSLDTEVNRNWLVLRHLEHFTVTYVIMISVPLAVFKSKNLAYPVSRSAIFSYQFPLVESVAAHP